MHFKMNWAGARVEYFGQVDSTNRAAKESDLPHGTLFLAERQTMGRGRSGRRWQSDPGLGIYATLLLRPERLEARYAPRATQLAAVAVAEGLRDLGVPALIKWPNDIVADGKKICGILCESTLSGLYADKIVLGVGINHLHTEDDFDESFRAHATSVRMLLEDLPSRERVLQAYLSRVEANYQRALSGMLLARYSVLSATLGREVRVLGSGEEWSGTAVKLTDDGALVIRTMDGAERAAVAGDVSVRGLMGYV